MVPLDNNVGEGMEMENPNKITSLRVSVATLERLRKHGNFGDTYERIINKLLDMAEKQYQGEKDEQITQGSKL